MEVDREGKLKLNYTSCGCMPMDGPGLMDIDWERKILNYTSSGFMLMEVDWGGKLNLNYTS